MIAQTLLLLLTILAFINSTYSAGCKNGATVLVHSLSAKDRKLILSQHNKFRYQVQAGKVRGQPKAKGMKTMKYDQRLANLAKQVSYTCKFAHHPVKDSRFKKVGQNIHVQYSKTRQVKAEWAVAIKSWFDEHEFFQYPHRQMYSNKQVGHYTQLIWADSNLIGCDFIAFKDNSRALPFGRLYTCSYGPGGNVPNTPPYKT